MLTEKLGGQRDPVVVSAAREEKRILVTLDKGIADPRSPDIVDHAGIVLPRLKHPSISAILSLLSPHVETLKQLSIDGKIVVLSSTDTRIR